MSRNLFDGNSHVHLGSAMSWAAWGQLFDWNNDIDRDSVRSRTFVDNNIRKASNSVRS